MIKAQQMREIAEKYKQALEEIKDILNKGAKIHDDIVVNKQILQQCEVLND